MEVLSSHEAVEKAFLKMIETDAIRYHSINSQLSARRNQVRGPVCYDFTLTKGKYYEGIRAEEADKYARIQTDEEVCSLKIATQLKPKTDDAVVTTILTLPLKSSEIDMNARIGEAIETGHIFRRYLKECTSNIEDLQTTMVSLNHRSTEASYEIAKFAKVFFESDNKKFELIVNNTTEDAIPKKPTIIFLRDFGKKHSEEFGCMCGLKTCSNSNNISKLEVPLSEQMKMLETYLSSQTAFH